MLLGVFSSCGRDRGGQRGKARRLLLAFYVESEARSNETPEELRRRQWLIARTDCVVGSVLFVAINAAEGSPGAKRVKVAWTLARLCRTPTIPRYFDSILLSYSNKQEMHKAI
jgi:hypothetical protein